MSCFSGLFSQYLAWLQVTEIPESRTKDIEVPTVFLQRQSLLQNVSLTMGKQSLSHLTLVILSRPNCKLHKHKGRTTGSKMED